MVFFTELIGYTAAFVGTLLMLPQVIKSYQTKSVKDVSFIMIIMYIVNDILWAIYGVLISSIPLVVCNVIAFGIGVTQLGLKMKYK